MDRHIQAAETYANFLDNQFNVLGIRFGLNMILDTIPELGDILAALLSLYIVWIAIQMDLPPLQIFLMLINIGINLVFGLIPVVGEITYVLRKANLKNVKILKKYARKQIIHPVLVTK